MSNPRTTIQVALELGVPEWRIRDAIRTQAIDAPPIYGGTRLWSDDHVAALRTVLEARGVLKSAAAV